MRNINNFPKVRFSTVGFFEGLNRKDQKEEGRVNLSKQIAERGVKIQMHSKAIYLAISPASHLKLQHFENIVTARRAGARVLI